MDLELIKFDRLTKNYQVLSLLFTSNDITYYSEYDGRIDIYYKKKHMLTFEVWQNRMIISYTINLITYCDSMDGLKDDIISYFNNILENTNINVDIILSHKHSRSYYVNTKKLIEKINELK